MKQESPLSFRIEPELNQRLEECSKRLRVKKYTLALLALEAAVEAVEKNDYRIALPIKFDVTHVVTKKPHEPATYPSREAEPTVLNEGTEANSPATKEGTAESFLDTLAEDIHQRGKRARARQKGER